MSIRIVAGTVGLALLSSVGCRRDHASSGSTAARPAGPSLLAAESTSWSAEQAGEKLLDPQLGISAAVRLVRLSEAAPACVPDELSDELIRQLRLLPLGGQLWALGLRDPRDARCLHAAVLLSVDGAVLPLAEGLDEELLVLHVAEDAEVFPHLALLPDRLLIVAEEAEVAIELQPEQVVRFDCRRKGGFPYVALVPAGAGRADEVAQYRWDPYEEAFMGPAADKVGDPPDGRFHINLEASPRLVPMGGELPEAKPVPEPGPKPELPRRQRQRERYLPT